jgi:hypothetical protein
MSESITISRKDPDSNSRFYEFLREEGIKHIQNLAGKIWTDYNAHDPGISILEVLSYAITELGYRADYPIKDILAKDASSSDSIDIKNFFTAREILPNAPVTINDYRKLLIDVAVKDPVNSESDPVGVKNAWILKSESNEEPVFVHKQDSLLAYETDPLYVLKEGETSQQPLEIGILYDILLEFEKCETFGDLNENTIAKSLVIDEHTLDTNLSGLCVNISVEFPRWDNLDVDWAELASVKSEIIKIILSFSNHPSNYQFSYELVNNIVKLEGSITTASDVVNIPGLQDIEDKINDFLYFNEDSLYQFYLLKINKIEGIIDKVKARLHANRNLCEDFYQLSALKVEKIAVCADIELEQDADVDEVQAIIYHEIAKFLSPTVNFYTLQEMLDKCKQKYEYSILSIDKTNKSFTVEKDLEDILNVGEEITIFNSRSNDGEYTVKSISVDDDTENTKIFVEEDIFSDLLTESEVLYFYVTDEDECLTVDEIFEGPALEHGFIDNQELELADREKYIHVSDIIRIIMNISGVVAVKSIQIANIPQDNEDGAIPSKSVKWCLNLAFDQNYVPRLSILNSKITFYKDQLPFRASATNVEELIDALEATERTSKLVDPVLDFEVPQGSYQNLEDYESIQNEFPITYGIGDEGLATVGYDEDELKERKAVAKQLKGYLMVFDQLLANYFSQLAHVKDLFSMNAEKDDLGNYIIGRTYYTQPLFDIVPNVDELYVDKGGHAVALDGIAEDEELFNTRKNKFLDHLLGRFAEKFTDYALLTFKLSGELKAPKELIEDKLAFLNAYPLISSSRGKGFNHQSLCNIWHIDNISGLRRRVAYLTGINEIGVDKLIFNSAFSIQTVGDEFSIQVSNSLSQVLLVSPFNFGSEEEAKMGIEELIINGVSKEKYRAVTDDDVNYFFVLECNDTIIGISERQDFPDALPGGEMDNAIDDLIEIFSDEFYNNPESNRNNLTCPLLNYIDYSIAVDMEPDPPVATVSYNLYSNSLTFNSSDRLLSGHYDVEGSAKSEVDIISVDTVTRTIVVDGNIAEKLSVDDVVVIDNSTDNNGTYTVVSSTDSGANTEIIVNETISSTVVPLGELYYNNDTTESLQKKAGDSIHDILWQLVKSAATEGRYYYIDDGGDYKFRIRNSSGIDIAESIENNFNEALATEISNLSSGAIKISGSTDNDGDYTITSASANGDEVEIVVSPNLTSLTVDGAASFSDSFTYSVNLEKNSILVSTDLTSILFVGDSLNILGSESNDDTYSVLAIDFDGSETEIIVKETIPSEDTTGLLVYIKKFSIQSLTNNSITIKGGYEKKAVQALIKFIQEKFFEHEGLHILEHVLIRPKVKGLCFVDATAETLSEGLADNGSLYFKKSLPIYSASSSSNWFRIDGDISADIDRFDDTDISSEFTISESGANDADYTVRGVQYDGGSNRTTIRSHENVPVDISFSDPVGVLSYLKGTPITSLSAVSQSIEVNDPEALTIQLNDEVEIRGSTDDINNGKYLVAEVIDYTTHQEIVFSKIEAEIEDDLLEIVVEDADCPACQITDPYTCVASVILPHWQGRFDNMDFRRYFEKQLRLEAPAHVFLNICWINCEQMFEFETKYKAWLLENAKVQKDYGKLSASLNNLIDIHKQLRTIYPSGVLHDCEETETLDNAIILDYSVLGNA